MALVKTTPSSEPTKPRQKATNTTVGSAIAGAASQRPKQPTT